jgi:hypothetical protein
MLAATVLLFALTASPQAKQAATGSSAETTSAGDTSEPTEAAYERHDSRATRDDWSALLERHPREVGVMLKLDPTLFQNEAWMSSYPALREFIAAHPEVARNSSYYLERVWIPGDEAPEPAAVRTTRQMMEGIQIFAVMLTIIAAFAWLIRTLLEHRRWSRVSRVQTEIYNKLLDRFTSHEDLMRYVQSEAGKSFIQSAISPISTGNTPAVAAPVGRILWSAQAGIVLVMIGFGLQYVSGRLHADITGSVSTLGILTLCAGLGFAFSAVAAWIVSRRLGILPPPPPESGETEVGSARTLGER